MIRKRCQDGTLGLFILGLFMMVAALGAQNQPQPPGRSIGTVTTRGDLIVLELDAGVIASPNLFDLGRRTLRFTRDGAGYRAQNMPVQWDAELGTELKEPLVTLRNFTFPYSGKSWNSFVVGQTGTISFGVDPPQGRGGRGGGGGGATVGRFAELREAASTLVNANPAIDVFLKPRVSGPRFVKELADRVVVTWTLTEPSAGVFDFTWVPTVNRFQAVLRKDGGIDFSYDEVAVKDAIVGLYPMVTTGAKRQVATFADPEDPAVGAHLDIRSVKASVIDGLFLEVAIETRGPIIPQGDAQLGGIAYRVAFDFDKPFATGVETMDADVMWTIRGTTQGRGGGGGGGGTPRYVASGTGASTSVRIEGNTISLVGTLPRAFKSGEQIGMAVDAMAAGTPPATVDQLQPVVTKLDGLRSPEIDLSAVNRRDGPFSIVFESFHHAGLPRTADMACSVIKALGDRFDFLAWYSDFRVDNQEAGTPATGPMDNSITGFRPGGGGRGPESFCSGGRLQSTFIQPIYIGSNQGMERSPDGTMNGYNLGMSQIGHELGHRWAAFASATVNGETFPLGPTHWARGLQVPAAYPYRRPVEASAMGGGAWKDNGDGTFTQLDDDFYVPANGYSHLDLYFMGIIPAPEVPDFFLLRNLVAAGKDDKGNPIFRADRVNIRIQDVIAANGPRMPPYEQARKQFNTGIVAIVMKGSPPSRELIERANGIRQEWINYWSKTTGGRSTMTTSPQGETK